MKHMIRFALMSTLIFIISCSPTSSDSDNNLQGDNQEMITCTFMVASDMRGLAGSAYKYDTYEYFKGACQEAKNYNPDFVILAGDQDPPQNAKWTIDQYLGIPTVFTIGNHDAESDQDINAIIKYNRDFQSTGASNFRRFTQTTFSFDYENCHFIIVDLYENSTVISPKPRMSTELLDWIEHDLKNSNQKFKFVIGHVPFENAPDIDTGKKRSYGLREEIIDKAERFWRILKSYNVTAYFCGHSHFYSHNKYGNVWQVNAGVALVNTATDTDDNFGSFVVIEVTDIDVTLRAWRAFGSRYELKYTVDITQ
ncbi:MAG: metallophosphoesterase [Kiritimatiellae bacterium]|jgi:predicted phosphodiesterase|nr:metallophosphoesterase [Kiritimatiellia bacterium]